MLIHLRPEEPDAFKQWYPELFESIKKGFQRVETARNGKEWYVYEIEGNDKFNEIMAAIWDLEEQGKLPPEPDDETEDDF